MKKDYYDVLNVQRSASEGEIKKSFRKLAQTCHPDKNQGDPAAEEAFKEINEAYEVLMDSEKRANYDRFGHNGPQPGAGFNPFAGFGGMGANPFADFFHGDMFGGRGGAPQGRQRGEGLQCVVEVSLEEVFAGCEKEIQFSKHVKCTSCTGTGSADGAELDKCAVCGGMGRVGVAHGPFHVMQSCPACRGEGQSIRTPCRACRGEGRVTGNQTVRIHIPVGVEDGTQLRAAGNGSAGRRGGSAGDLICVIKVKEHTRYKRNGTDLHCKIDIPFALAALGGDIPVQGINETYTLNIPQGTHSETVLRISSGGLRTPSGRGDMYVQIRVTVPSSLTEEQKQALLVFANL